MRVHLMTSPKVGSILQALSGEPNATEISGILGYNDKQAFQGDGQDDYGPVAELFAVPKLWSQTELEAGQVVALLAVGPKMKMPAEYTRLHIGRSSTVQLFCVALKKGNGANWEGSIDSIRAGQPGCDPPTWNLSANFQDASGFTADTDLPKWAARFADDNAGKPSVAVRCLTGWCEIGRVPGNGHRPPMTPGQQVKEDQVKTWSDDQVIADARPQGRGGIMRSVRASIVPAPGLGGKHQVDFTAGGTTASTMTGIKVATILMGGTRPSAAKYATWGLNSGTAMSPGVTDVWMRYLDGGYQAQFVGAGATATPTGTWYYVYRTEHTVPVPGTARWVWDPQDEGVWIGCDQGCCEISQDQFSSPQSHSAPAASRRNRRGNR